MIEVEKKFQPTEEQLAKLLEGAEFISDLEHTDTYYDMPDFRFFKKDIHLRKRNDYFELKIDLKTQGGGVGEEEMEDEKEILRRLGFPEDENLSDVVARQMPVLLQIKTKRKKYKKGEFTIDIDETDFGHSVCEVEILAQDQSEASSAKERIIALVTSCGIPIIKIPGKVRTYLKLKKPEVYKEIYGDN